MRDAEPSSEARRGRLPSPATRRGVPASALVLGGIVLLGLVLRLWGVKYGLPFGYQTDEERLYVRHAAHMLDASTLDPHYRLYGGGQEDPVE